MEQTRATLATQQGQRLLTRLGRHWSHKFDVTLDTSRLDIPFSPESRATIQIHDTGLEVTIESQNGEALDKLQTVVAEQLQRFASDEVLAFHWQ